MEALPVNNEPGTVYFIEERVSETMKIGFTATDVQKRFYNLQNANPRDLYLHAWFAGSKEIERHLHSLFDKDRIRGEWFNFTEEMEDFIGWLEDKCMEFIVPVHSYQVKYISSIPLSIIEIESYWRLGPQE